MNRKFKGFTLAETLITLVIIGIVAALTVPNMLHNYTNKEFVSKFKKSYSVLSQAFILAQAKNGLISYWDWSSKESGYKNLEDFVLPNLQVLKNCKVTVNEKCIPDRWYFSNGNYWHTPDETAEYKFILNDGMEFAVNVRPNCVEDNHQCLDIHLDTNGTNGPNKRGKDLFSFYAYPHTNDIKPGGVREGTPGVTYNAETKTWSSPTKEEILSNCSSSGNGVFCGARIILEGYKINY